MKREQLLHLARRAGFRTGVMHDARGDDTEDIVRSCAESFTHELEMFARLVATAEREACRVACREAVLGLTEDQRQSGDMLDFAIATAIRNAREA